MLNEKVSKEASQIWLRTERLEKERSLQVGRKVDVSAVLVDASASPVRSADDTCSAACAPPIKRDKCLLVLKGKEDCSPCTFRANL